MRLTAMAGIDVPFHGFIYDKDGELHYIIKRFDRLSALKKIPVEDFAQLSGKNRETKYDSSMENVAGVIEKYCTFPGLEFIKLFKLIIFNFLTGNEDMHLKNFSVITIDNVTSLSPAYDLLNTTILSKTVTEEIALPLKGKKKNITKNNFIKYFGDERLKLNKQVVETVLSDFKKMIPAWKEEIKISFLREELKKQYIIILEERGKILGL